MAAPWSSKSASGDYPNSGLTGQIIGAFYAVYNELGTGFRESVYQRALKLGLEATGLAVQLEYPLTIRFQGNSVGTFRADLVVEQLVVLELKALPELLPAHQAQLLNLLKATGLEVGLLLNFGPKPSIKRCVLSHARIHQRPPAPNQRNLRP